MDELKLRAGERFEALHVAAKSAADNGKTRVHDIYSQTSEALRKIREIFNELWHNELITDARADIVYLHIREIFNELWHNELMTEARARAAVWTQETLQRIREGAPPLSPVLLYEELRALFKDRVWRRSMLIFISGVAIGGSAGLVLGLRAVSRAPLGPHSRALHTHPDQSVILVEDAVTPGAGAGEVLIRVQAFSVCVADRAVLRGRGQTLRTLISRTQLTVGRGFAGVVLDVGAGVSELELGDEVWGCVSEWSGGAASELLTVRSTRVSKRPRGLAADTAASLPWAGALALSALSQLRYSADNCKAKRVAICGAASGEGCILVQLLSGWKADVCVVAPRHAAASLQDLGAHEVVDVESTCSWSRIESQATRGGPWDALLVCSGSSAPANMPPNPTALLRSTAPRDAILDLRPRALLSDRLFSPLPFVFAVTFYSFRVLRWLLGRGTHTDWLENQFHLSPGLDVLAKLVDAGEITPVLDKVYLPQDFEDALAHACSEEAIGTTVIRFP